MFEKQLKRIKLLDLALVKFAVAVFVLFVLAIWPAAMDWVKSVNPWYFLVVSLVAAAIPAIRVWKK